MGQRVGVVTFLRRYWVYSLALLWTGASLVIPTPSWQWAFVVLGVSIYAIATEESMRLDSEIAELSAHQGQRPLMLDGATFWVPTQLTDQQVADVLWLTSRKIEEQS